MVKKQDIFRVLTTELLVYKEFNRQTSNLHQSLNEQELAFFADLTHLVQAKYPEMKEKFGIWRVHQHFELAQDEVLHETSDPTTRESTLRIIKKENLPKHAFASTWRITEEGIQASTWCCDDIDRVKP